MYKVIKFDKEKEYVEDFLLLPKKLYSKKEIMQNEAEERKIVEETHVLNKYFKQHKLVVYKNKEISGRCIITIYPNEEYAYIGYFECIDDSICAKELFTMVEKIVKKEHLRKILGPVDSSFWIKYRLKIDNFEKTPYTGEPYNKSYYKKMFEDNGYNILESWVSNIYTKLPIFYNSKKTVYNKRLEQAEEKKYVIVSPNIKDFDKTLEIIYTLISETFKEFITFKEIKKEDFMEIFKNYKYILDYNFVKIAYYNEEPVAFSIVLPNYHNLLYGRLTMTKKIRIMLKKIRSSNYVSLYMGVKKEHKGLGKALTQKIIRNVYIRKAGCIGALITQGKITEKYVEEQIKNQNRYVLFEKEI